MGSSRTWFAVALLSSILLLPGRLAGQETEGPFARIAVLEARDGRTTDFEAGYIRHLDWHQRVDDPFRWYGYTVWVGERPRLFVYATFGHSAAALGNPVQPAEDERDNVLNVVPHADFREGGLFEFLPAASLGAAAPTAHARLEFVTVTLRPGSERAFEAALNSARAALRGETLWYRLAAGGRSPTYVRLRPRRTLAEIVEDRAGQALPPNVSDLIATTEVQIMNFRPTLSYRVTPVPR